MSDGGHVVRRVLRGQWARPEARAEALSALDALLARLAAAEERAERAEQALREIAEGEWTGWSSHVPRQLARAALASGRENAS